MLEPSAGRERQLDVIPKLSEAFAVPVVVHLEPANCSCCCCCHCLGFPDRKTFANELGRDVTVRTSQAPFCPTEDSFRRSVQKVLMDGELLFPRVIMHAG